MNEVACIIASTLFDNAEKAYDQYGDSYWIHYPKHVVMHVLDEIWNRVVQTRLHGIVIDMADGEGCWIYTDAYTDRPFEQLTSTT